MFSPDKASMTLGSSVVMPFKGQRLRNGLLDTINEFQSLYEIIVLQLLQQAQKQYTNFTVSQC